MQIFSFGGEGGMNEDRTYKDKRKERERQSIRTLSKTSRSNSVCTVE